MAESFIGVDIPQLPEASGAESNAYVVVRKPDGKDYKILKSNFQSGTQQAAEIPDWNESLIFNTDGSGAGKYCVYNLKIWRTLIDGNQNITPSEGSNWTEVSRSEPSGMREWAAGIYNAVDVVVKRLGKIVELINPTRPFESIDIEAEIANGDWRYIPVGVGGGSGSGYENTYTSVPAMIAGQGDQNSGSVQFVSDASKDFPGAGQGDPTVETAGSWAEYVYLGTTNGDLTDYRKRAEEESVEGGGSGTGTGVFEPVQDITELKNIDTNSPSAYPDKWTILVEDEENWYRFDRDSSVSESLPKIVAPNTGPGRWFQTPDVDLSAKADKDDTIPDGEVLKKKSGGNYEGTGYGADQVVQLNDVDVTDISEGESKILTVLKEVGTGNPVFEGAVQQLDKIVSSSFDSLLADTADWVGDILTLSGDNSNGQLGENGQEHQMNGQFYLCISHVLDVTGSATWVRNRSRDALDPSLSSDQAVITELEDPTGWDSEDTKIISVRSKVGSWYSDVSGYFYACFDESGSNWYWRRIGVPTAEFIQISDQALKDEIEAHDFGATPILKPVATEKGKDRQEHYWEKGASQTGEVLASGDGTTKQFTGNLANTEVNPGSVSITDGSQVATDDGDGNLIGDIDGAGNNTIDYSTGAYDVTFAAAPPSGTDNITADYESEPFTPHLAKCIDDGGTKKWIKQI